MTAENELSEISKAIGSVRWMDPPDGGDVSLAEQVRRMRADLETAEADLRKIADMLHTCFAAGVYDIGPFPPELQGTRAHSQSGYAMAMRDIASKYRS